MKARFPDRIICLTEETTETLYLLGEQERIIGISGYTVRPPQARKEKPKISAFTSANISKIIGLKPDLVLGFSDLQADIAKSLIEQGLNVVTFNQRSVQQILDMILMLGSMVGAQKKSESLIRKLEANITHIKQQAQSLAKHPKVYFEEWDSPIISGIRWVSEIIEIAGGVDCFKRNAKYPKAKDRIIADADEVISANPDVIIGSWCGKKFRPEKVKSRAGWDNVSAVRNNCLYEIKSSIILQPGPAALTDGLNAMHGIIKKWDQ